MMQLIADANTKALQECKVFASFDLPAYFVLHQAIFVLNGCCYAMKNAFAANDPEHIEPTQCIERTKPCFPGSSRYLLRLVQLFSDNSSINYFSCIIYRLHHQPVCENREGKKAVC